MLYLLYILHQTTTLKRIILIAICCISYISYIKPQLILEFIYFKSRCISYISYIKPQPSLHNFLPIIVVSLIYPTSNHNYNLIYIYQLRLYLLYILHQTTTSERCSVASNELYLLYILHQTTTFVQIDFFLFCCISYISYIKPQQKIIN